MRTTDWNYDFSALPRWDNRERIPYIYDEYFEIPQSDTLCCLYSICEVGMLNYQGFLAILKNKADPKLVLNLTEGFNFCVNFSASDDGNLLFLQPSVYLPAKGRSVCPVLLVDIQNNRFAFLKTANYCTAYRVIQKKPHLFVIETDEQSRKCIPQLAALHGKKIRTRWLKWYTIDALPKLPKMLF